MKRSIQSFVYAMNGVIITIKEEPHFRFHIMALVVAIALGWYLDLTKLEWLMIVMVSGLVLVAELVNTAIENICNRITTDHDTAIGRIKDISAAAVLVSAIVAMIVALVVFLPYILIGLRIAGFLM